jgi:type IV pilus assembly protein PilX
MTIRNIKQAQGSVLIVSLVILLVLTLLGLSGMGNTVLQERMAGNLQEGQSAFQAAEAGLRDGEAEASSTAINAATVFKPSCAGGLCEPADPTKTYDVWVTTTSSAVYWDSENEANDRNTRLYGSASSATLANVSRPPAYIIEKLNVVERGRSIVVGVRNQPTGEWYRITSKGFGRNGQAESMVQSVIRK